MARLPHIESILKSSAPSTESILEVGKMFTEMAMQFKYDQIKDLYAKIELQIPKWSSKSGLSEITLSVCSAATHYVNNEYDQALAASKEAIELGGYYRFPDLSAHAYLLNGATFRAQGELADAMTHFNHCIRIGGLSPFLTLSAMYNLGSINIEVGDFSTAEQNFREAIRLSGYTDIPRGQFRSRQGLASLFLKQNKLEDFKQEIEAALKVEGISDADISRGCYDLGIYYYETKDYEKAKQLFLESYELRLTANYKDAASTSLLQVANTHLAQGQYKQAEHILEKGLKICFETQSKHKLMQYYQILADTHEQLGYYEKAVQSLRKYVDLQEELNHQQVQNIYQQKNSEIQHQKQQIETAHREITSSIEYAKRIQNAILPSGSQLQKHFENGFVLYQPKDVVAGDFYWLEPNSDGFFFAAADCTGHGVPGAMVSVICNGSLNRSVREFGLTDPGKILDKTRELVIQEFIKSDEEVLDGMDIALCSLSGFDLTFAGANNPLWVIRGNELFEYKSDKQPIGAYDRMMPFNTVSIKLQPGDTIYIFSDGFQDQFGGERGKKYKSARFKGYLQSIQGRPIAEHSKLLKTEFDSWRGSHEQIDDVCIIGLQV